MPRLIGFAGNAGSGKDTAADMLVAEHGFEKVAFADPIREMLRAGFALEDRHFNEDKELVIPWLDVSPRHLMQTLGTEWGRHKVRKDIWVRYMRRRLRYAKEREINVVVSDVRFGNEADLIHEMGGEVVLMFGNTVCPPSWWQHPSERLVDVRTDRVIDNTGSLDELRAQVERLL